jgi:type II secretory pathway pseudopilin PulG
MPIAAPVIAALITAGVSGTEIGLQASGAFQPSTSGQTKALEQQNQQQQLALQQQKQQAFRGAAGDAQAATGGALTDKSFSQLVAELSGNPGDLQLAQDTLFGSGGGGTGPTGLSS